MRIGRYDVTGEIGRGGMGVVLRGRAPDGRDVAIKVLSHQKRDAHARFEREGRLLTALGEAQGFVPCLEVGESPTGPFIVMPFVEGGTLRERIARGAMPIDEAVRLIQELAVSVGRAHERGIVHRDLKPENILFKGERPLVTDLGLARHYDRAVLDGSRSYALSRAGESRGTAGYMAPEQLSDARTAKPSADVFALGAILYECLTATPALGGGNILEQFGRVESGRIRRPSELRAGIPAWLDRVLLRALAFEPARRYADGHAFAKALATRGARSLRLPAVALGALAVLAVGAALLLVPRKPVASAARAEQLLDASKNEEALLEAQAAIDADPRDARAYAARGEARFRKIENASAKADFDRALELDPKLALAWFRRGAHAIRTDDAVRGAADFTKGLEIDPWSSEAFFGRARVLGALKDLPRARADLDRAIEIDPKRAKYWGLRGAVRGVMGDLEGSFADLDKAIELAPDVAEHWSNRCGAWFNRGDYNRCIADGTKALSLDPKDTNALATRAGAWINRGEHIEEALADLNRALSINPRCETALVNRAAYSIRNNVDVARAVDDLKRAAAIAPRSKAVYSNMCVACDMAGDMEGVAKAADRYLELAPDDHHMRLQRANLRVSNKDWKGAIEDANRYIEAMGSDPSGYRPRGVAHMELGEREAAIADFEKYLSLGPKHEKEIASVKRRLAKLQEGR